MPPLRAARPDASRYDTLDLMRGLVIVFVVLFHTDLRFQLAGYNIARGMPRWLAPILFGNAYQSMAAIFTISGFIIAYTSIQRFGSLPQIHLATFYRFRFARIMPPLLLLVAVLSLLHLVHLTGFTIKASQGETLPHTLLSVLTFHLNLYESIHGLLPICWDVLWTLSVEELFYFIFPLLCVTLLRVRAARPIFILLLFALVAAGPPSRTIWAFNDLWARKGYLSAMDGIALGVLTAMLTARLRGSRLLTRRSLLAIQALGVLLLALAGSGPRWDWLKAFKRPIIHSGLNETLVAVAVCLIMLAGVLRNPRGSRFLAPLRWYGRHSYELYLTHEFVVIAASVIYVRLPRGPFIFWIIATLLATAPLGWAFATFYSEPLNRRLRGRKRTPPQTLATPSPVTAS